MIINQTVAFRYKNFEVKHVLQFIKYAFLFVDKESNLNNLRILV